MYSKSGGTVGKCIVAGCGLLLTVFALVVSFFPPSQLTAQAGTVYVITLLICWAISVAIPFVIYGLRKHWDGTSVQPAQGVAATSAVSSAAHQAPSQATVSAAPKEAVTVASAHGDSGDTQKKGGDS